VRDGDARPLKVGKDPLRRQKINSFSIIAFAPQTNIKDLSCLTRCYCGVWKATHEIALMSDIGAKELLGFIEMLLHFIYEFPKMIREKP
jgi:hypothetical protein